VGRAVRRRPRARVRAGALPLALAELAPLESLAGTAERDSALAHLVAMVRASRGALWAVDAPFGLPVEILDAGTTWAGQLRLVREWAEGAYALGLWACGRGRAVREAAPAYAARGGAAMHVRRATDREERAPFDPYHYRIIYQTFHAMRDVVAPLVRARETAVLPFHYRRVARARRVLVEACPSSTLRRLGLPNQNYKQPEGGRLTARRRAVRREIFAGLAARVSVPNALRLRALRDPGGDALDAIVAAVGAHVAWRERDHRAIARDSRAMSEGVLYV
jgi:hypothetical protein